MEILGAINWKSSWRPTYTSASTTIDVEDEQKFAMYGFSIEMLGAYIERLGDGYSMLFKDATMDMFATGFRVCVKE